MNTYCDVKDSKVHSASRCLVETLCEQWNLPKVPEVRWFRPADAFEATFSRLDSFRGACSADGNEIMLDASLPLAQLGRETNHQLSHAQWLQRRGSAGELFKHEEDRMESQARQDEERFPGIIGSMESAMRSNWTITSGR
jgi:hypothetical protein